MKPLAVAATMLGLAALGVAAMFSRLREPQRKARTPGWVCHACGLPNEGGLGTCWSCGRPAGNVS